MSSPAPLQEDFVYEDTEALCSELRTLATDSNKYRAKADRRRQRSTFRAVLHFVEVRAQRGMAPRGTIQVGFPGSSVSKESACIARDHSSVPGLGSSPGDVVIF